MIVDFAMHARSILQNIHDCVIAVPLVADLIIIDHLRGKMGQHEALSCTKFNSH